MDPRPNTPDRDTGDPQDRAEVLDGDRLGEDVGDEARPGVRHYPPDQPMAVEDPMPPDGGPEPVADRETRRRADTREGDEGTALVKPDGGTGVPDDEATEVAAEVDEPGDLSPEQAAVRTLDEGG